MKKQYLQSRVYADDYVSLSGRTTKLTIEHVQIIKKSFYVKGLEKEYKPYYYLSIYIDFEFDRITEHNIKLQNIKSSIIAVEKELGINEAKSYEEYSIKENFADYIKRNYKEKVNELKQLNIEGTFTTYEIKEEDLIKIKESTNYVEKILERENEITILSDMGIKFETTKSLQKGLDIYKGYSILRNMEKLKDETIVNLSNSKIKRNKI